LRIVATRLPNTFTPFRHAEGPRLFILIPIVDRIGRLATISLNIRSHRKDNVPARVNAAAYFRIVDPNAAIVQIENVMVATSPIAQTTRRSGLGQHMLDELLSERDKTKANGARRSSTPRASSRPRAGEEHPVALQLRYLQTLLELGASQATTIVFPAPIDLLRPFLNWKG
jgi:hypothetical protein